MPEITDPVAGLVAGHSHSSVITAQKRLFVWGGNNHGELGLGRPGSVLMSYMYKPSVIPTFHQQFSISTLALGTNHALYVDTTGGMWSSGSNKEGQLGLGTPLQDQVSERSGREHSVPIVLMMRQMDARVRFSISRAVLRIISRGRMWVQYASCRSHHS